MLSEFCNTFGTVLSNVSGVQLISGQVAGSDNGYTICTGMSYTHVRISGNSIIETVRMMVNSATSA